MMSKCVYTMTGHVHTMSRHIFVIPMALSMTLFHSLAHNDLNEVIYYFPSFDFIRTSTTVI